MSGRGVGPRSSGYSALRLLGARTDWHFVLRVPPGIDSALKRAARKNGRSINSEVIFLLAKGLNMFGDGDRA